MTRKWGVVLLSVMLCMTIFLFACTAHKTDEIKTAEADNIEKENFSTIENKQEIPVVNKEIAEVNRKQSADETTDNPAGEKTEEPTKTAEPAEPAEPTETPTKEQTTTDKESQKTSEATGTANNQQSPTQQNPVQQNTVQQNTGQRNNNTNVVTSTNSGNKTVNIDSLRTKMLELINAERKKAGIPLLSLDTELTKVAQLKAEDMVKNNYFSHTSPTYGDPFTMMEKFGLKYMAAGENLAGAPSVEKAHNGLMNSPGHRANILKSDFIRIGIGIKESPKYGYVFVQMFAGKTVDEYRAEKESQQENQKQHTANESPVQQNTSQENTSYTQAEQKPLSIGEMQAKMLELLNVERKKAGVKSLTLNSDLTKLAQLKAEDLVKNNYFDHNSPTYGWPHEMAQKLGYVVTGISENICLSSSVESAHEALMNSSGHRANILREGNNIIGIGIHKRPDGKYMFVQMFAENIYKPDLLFQSTIKNTITKWCSQNSVPALKQSSKLNSLAMEYFNVLVEQKDVSSVDSSKYTPSLAGVIIHSFSSLNLGTDSLEKEIAKLLDSQKDVLPSSYGFVVGSKIIEKTETFTRYANYVIVVIEGQAVKEGQEIPIRFSR